MIFSYRFTPGLSKHRGRPPLLRTAGAERKDFLGFDMKLASKEVVRLPGLEYLTKIKRATLYDMQNPNSPRFDATFPAKVRLGARAVGWFLDEVLEWLESRKVVSQARGTK